MIILAHTDKSFSPPKITFEFESPEKLKNLNVFQLRKLARRTRKFGLSELVEQEHRRRIKRVDKGVKTT